MSRATGRPRFNTVVLAMFAGAFAVAQMALVRAVEPVTVAMMPLTVTVAAWLCGAPLYAQAVDPRPRA